MNSLWLAQHYEDLNECQDQDNMMDGSGECGGIIAEHYVPYYGMIEQVLEGRGDIEMLHGQQEYQQEHDGDLPF
jgi:hypothetical protein